MKEKQTYFMRASFALVIFMVLGYLIKFYPETLTGFDSSIQTVIRGDLSDGLTRFFKVITQLGSEIYTFVYTFAIALVFYFWKKWKAEAYFLTGNLLLMGIFSTGFKYLYNRARPSVAYLIAKPMGPSFPSWHTAATMIIALTLIVIIQRRLTNHFIKRCLQAMLLILAILTAVSRIYLGVHFPTDILGGWLLAYTIATAVFPFYNQKRFEWRFQSKQK